MTPDPRFEGVPLAITATVATMLLALALAAATTSKPEPPTNVRVPHNWWTATNLVLEGTNMWVELNGGVRRIFVNDAGKTNIVNALVATGTFCKVRGHMQITGGPCRICSLPAVSERRKP